MCARQQPLRSTQREEHQAVAEQALPEAVLVPSDDDPEWQQAEEYPDIEVAEQRIDDAPGELAVENEPCADDEGKRGERCREDGRPQRQRGGLRPARAAPYRGCRRREQSQRSARAYDRHSDGSGDPRTAPARGDDHGEDERDDENEGYVVAAGEPVDQGEASVNGIEEPGEHARPLNRL